MHCVRVGARAKKAPGVQLHIKSAIKAHEYFERYFEVTKRLRRVNGAGLKGCKKH